MELLLPVPEEDPQLSVGQFDHSRLRAMDLIERHRPLPANAVIHRIQKASVLTSRRTKGINRENDHALGGHSAAGRTHQTDQLFLRLHIQQHRCRPGSALVTRLGHIQIAGPHHRKGGIGEEQIANQLAIFIQIEIRIHRITLYLISSAVANPIAVQIVVIDRIRIVIPVIRQQQFPFPIEANFRAGPDFLLAIERHAAGIQVANHKNRIVPSGRKSGIYKASGFTGVSIAMISQKIGKCIVPGSAVVRRPGYHRIQAAAVIAGIPAGIRRCYQGAIPQGYHGWDPETVASAHSGGEGLSCRRAVGRFYSHCDHFHRFHRLILPFSSYFYYTALATKVNQRKKPGEISLSRRDSLYAACITDPGRSRSTGRGS